MNQNNSNSGKRSGRTRPSRHRSKKRSRSNSQNPDSRNDNNANSSNRNQSSNQSRSNAGNHNQGGGRSGRQGSNNSANRSGRGGRGNQRKQGRHRSSENRGNDISPPSSDYRAIDLKGREAITETLAIPTTQKSHQFNLMPEDQASSIVTSAQEEVKKPLGKSVFSFPTLAAAQEYFESRNAAEYDRDKTSILINEELNTHDIALRKFGKVYAGEAWTTIFQRRIEAGLINKAN